ncbi:hypothetical protein FBR00_16475 [Anaerolineae bacterium CFX4]|nr:hypothetical protein [Anaerolineae bacterium CFX4]
MERFKEYETVEYHLIYGALIAAARHRGTVTYQELAQTVGLPVTGNYMGRQIGELLGAVSQNEVINGRPMLSAVAVTSSGSAGGGFFTLARELGLLNSSHEADERKFLEDQQRKCYAIWKQSFGKSN